ncbi:MAG: ROK family protein [Candidatus Nomurabacteria bacterium]|jgi:predicted NBD/HSP70 family sugar kinase|nr:ROK family protein [Candidatus Nomurabacteria bacterium]
MILAIDTGGTKTLFAVVDGDRIVREEKVPTPASEREYIELLKSHADFITPDVTAIVLAAPADIEDGVIKYAANLSWRDFNVKTELSALAPENLPIYVINDAKLAALGVSTGAGRDLYLTLSTGIGAGLTIDGKLSQDLNSLEVGHAVVDGREWESLASAKAFVERYGRYGSDVPADDPAWSEYAADVAKGLLYLIPILRPDRIFFGGPMGHNLSKFSGELSQIVDSELSRQFTRPKLLPASDPERAVVMGATRYVENNR